MIKPTNEEMARYIVEQTGGCWHELEKFKLTYMEHCRTPEGYEDIERTHNGERCLHCKQDWESLPDNPTFTDDAGKVELLRLMMGSKDWKQFIVSINQHPFGVLLNDVVPLLYLVDDTTDTAKLLRAAYWFLMEVEK